MPSPDHRPDFLPGDPQPPREKLVVPEPEPPPARRYPLPLIILGGVLVAALLVGGFVMAPNDIAGVVRDIWQTITG